MDQEESSGGTRRPNVTNRDRYTKEQVAEALRECRGLAYLAAERLGCEEHTVSRYKKRYPELYEIVAECRGKIQDVAELGLYGAVTRGEPWAICFLLKTLGRTRGYSERFVSQAGAGWSPDSEPSDVISDDAVANGLATLLANAKILTDDDVNVRNADEPPAVVRRIEAQGVDAGPAETPPGWHFDGAG